MKFTQIAVALGEDGESLYALGEDGVVYEKVCKSEKAPDGGRVYTEWWEPVKLPIGEPERKR